MHSDAVVESHVDAGRLVIEVPPARADQRDGQIADLPLGCPPVRDALRALAPIDEQPGGAVHEDVGDQRIADMLGEGAECGVDRLGRGHVLDGEAAGGARTEHERFWHATTLGGPADAPEP